MSDVEGKPLMHSDDALGQERKGAEAGLNPMFGEWNQRFNFPPISYSGGETKRAAFRKAIQAELKNKFFYTDQVRLEIVLYLDVQTILETDETADVDNYAKAILDGLKGPSGLLLDDSQVQALTIYWLDSHGRDHSYFDISITGSPDDFLLQPVSFYEMPDGLWYPHGRLVWEVAGPKDLTDTQFYSGLLISETMCSVKKEARHLFRQSGMDRLRAYQRAMHVSSSLRGFHRSRVDGGFAMHAREVWQAALDGWRKEHPEESTDIEQIVTDIRENFGKMSALLVGQLPKQIDEHVSDNTATHYGE